MYQQQPIQMQQPYYNTMYNSMGYMQPNLPKGTNPLTLEQQQEMQQKGGLNLMPTKPEYYQAICTHRDIKTGKNVVIADETGTELTCPICGSQFGTLKMTQKDVEEATKVVSDILENIKVMYLDIPPEVCSEYMKILPMVKKIPALYKIAAANFCQYENAVNIAQTGTSNLISQYNYINGPTGPMYNMPNPAMGMMPQQPYMMGQQQPMAQQAYMAPYPNETVMQSAFTQQQMDMTGGGYNPFYGQQQQQQQPPQFTTMQSQNQQTQQQCNCGGHQQQQETVTVEKKFNV